ncbi:hypothetical protein TPR58_21970 [Sphingomonas sp. HF-S3]|uniref:Uncharacterized protein n=1 Tax=Sphingomonas rustica TaxID=3103142 RepID=A0ABV0BE80_9SPHN
MKFAGAVLRNVGKALFCLILSWALIVMTLGRVLLYFQISFPLGLLVLPAAVGMFMLFTRIEKDAAR